MTVAINYAPVHNVSRVGQNSYIGLWARPEVNPGAEPGCAASPGPLSAAVSSQNIHPKPQITSASRCPPGPAGSRPPPAPPLLPKALYLDQVLQGGFHGGHQAVLGHRLEDGGSVVAGRGGREVSAELRHGHAAPRPAARGSPRRAPEGSLPLCLLFPPAPHASLWRQGCGRSRRGRDYSRESSRFLPLRFRFRRRLHSGVSIPAPWVGPGGQWGALGRHWLGHWERGAALVGQWWDTGGERGGAGGAVRGNWGEVRGTGGGTGMGGGEDHWNRVEGVTGGVLGGDGESLGGLGMWVQRCWGGQ